MIIQYSHCLKVSLSCVKDEICIKSNDPIIQCRFAEQNGNKQGLFHSAGIVYVIFRWKIGFINFNFHLVRVQHKLLSLGPALTIAVPASLIG